MESAQKYHTGLKRLGAAIVDAIIFTPLILVQQWIYKTTSNVSILFIWITFISFLSLAYSIILHYYNGQTIGKWVASIKVVDVSERKGLTFLQSIYRDGFYLLIFIIGALYFGLKLTHSNDYSNTLSEYASFSNYPVFLWTIVELITMLSNPKRRALHDFLAKSVVVKI